MPEDPTGRERAPGAQPQAERRHVKLRRILLALDSNEDEAALSAAAALAEALRASLNGLFVEDSELLRLAGLPFIQEVTTAVVRRLEQSQLERDLRVQAERLRRSIERFARERRLVWSFSVVRGALLTAAMSAAREADLYVLGRHPLPYGAAGAPRPDGPLMVIYDGSVSAAHALEAAVALSRTGEGLLVVLPADAEPTAAALQQDAESRLLALGRPAHYLATPHLTPELLKQALRTYRVRLLFVGESCGLCEPTALRPLLREAPLVIAR